MHYFCIPQVLKADVDAALKVLNFAVYHKELTEMDEREHERERENERKRPVEDNGEDGDDPEGTEAGQERYRLLLLIFCMNKAVKALFCLLIRHYFQSTLWCISNLKP